jgi:hypothetical protein
VAAHPSAHLAPQTLRRLSVLGVTSAALALAAPAHAHVGASNPVATNFEARIIAMRPPAPGVTAKIVDGDGSLWLRSSPSTTVLIPGIQDEPLLRFDPNGVWVNTRSLTAQSDKIDRADLHPSFNPKLRPVWHRLTRAHVYIWHEHRLHALEVFAKVPRPPSVLGRWSMPMVIDGRHHALDGVLIYHRPGPVWPWFVLAAALALASAATMLRSRELGQHVAVRAALVVTLSVWAVRVGRDLYGRPAVSVDNWIDLGLTCLIGAGLVYSLLQRSPGGRLLGAFLAGFGGLAQAATTMPAFTRSIALSELPSTLVRVLLALALGLGADTAIITMREPLGDRGDEERPADSSVLDRG